MVNMGVGVLVTPQPAICPWGCQEGKRNYQGEDHNKCPERAGEKQSILPGNFAYKKRSAYADLS